MSSRVYAARNRLPAIACLHCGHTFRDASGHRRFCWPCRINPAIRALHPPKSNHGRRFGVGLRIARVLPEPTSARPGTEEKIKVMAARAERGELLHHPLDGRC